MDNDILMSFRIDDETKRKLTAISQEEDRSMSASIRQMINERYDALFVSIPKAGTISNEVVKFAEVK